MTQDETQLQVCLMAFRNACNLVILEGIDREEFELCSGIIQCCLNFIEQRVYDKTIYP